MSTSSRTWFYSKPEPRPYYIEERVNHTLWKNRGAGLVHELHTDRKTHQNGRELEWHPCLI